MKVGVVRDGTLKEVESKEFNIYLGISLGNKWFTKENLKGQLLWAIEHTKERVGLLVADTLHAINYEVRNHEKPENARRKSLRKGDEMVSILREIIKELPKEKQKIIDIIRWDEVKADSFNELALPVIYHEFEKDGEFRKAIEDIVQKYLSTSQRKLAKEKLELLCCYILNELPELLHGFTFRGTYYNCYLYPHDSDLTQMVEKIQKKEIFVQLHEKLDIKKNVFVELR